MYTCPLTLYKGKEFYATIVIGKFSSNCAPIFLFKDISLYTCILSLSSHSVFAIKENELLKLFFKFYFGYDTSLHYAPIFLKTTFWKVTSELSSIQSQNKDMSQSVVLCVRAICGLSTSHAMHKMFNFTLLSHSTCNGRIKSCLVICLTARPDTACQN